MSRSRRSTPNQSGILDPRGRPPRTKIVCSLRPDTDLETIKHLLVSGMNVARVASAFGTPTTLEALVNRIRAASLVTKRLCAIILETHGTSVMTGPVTMTQDHASDDTNIQTLNKDNDIMSQSDDDTDLSIISKTLNVQKDRLPSGILQNAQFAMAQIIESNQNNQKMNQENDKNTINNSIQSQNTNENDDKPPIYHLKSDAKRVSFEQDMGDEDDIDLYALQELRDTGMKTRQSQPLIVNRSRSASTNDTDVLQSSDSEPFQIPISVSSPMTKRNSLLKGKGSPFLNVDLGAMGMNDLDRNVSYNRMIQPDITLIRGSVVTIVTNKVIIGDRKKFSICFPHLTAKLTIGNHIIIHPSIKLEILSKDAHTLHCKVLNGGPLKEYQKVEFPSLKLRTSDITQQDVSDISLALHLGVDYVCISHVKSVKDIRTSKEMLDIHYARLHHERGRDRTNTLKKQSAENNIKNNHVKDTNIQMSSLPSSETFQTHKKHHFDSDRYHLLYGMQDEISSVNNNIKILAKIEDFMCLSDISAIIQESDGLIIDHLALLTSYNQKENIERNLDVNHRMISEILQSIVQETRRQAKPFAICCKIQTNVFGGIGINKMSKNKSVFFDEMHDNIKALSSCALNPVFINSFLSLDDISSIEFGISFGCDAVCVLSDINRLKDIYSEQSNYNGNDEFELNNLNMMYVQGVFRSLSDVIRKKEMGSRTFYQSMDGKYSFLTLSSLAFRNNNGNKDARDRNDTKFGQTMTQSASVPNRLNKLDINKYLQMHRTGSASDVKLLVTKLQGANVGGGVDDDDDDDDDDNDDDTTDSSVVNNIENKEQVFGQVIPQFVNNNSANSGIMDSVDSYSDNHERKKMMEVQNVFDSMASSAVKTAFDLDCSLIIVLTQSGKIARMVSKYRPNCLILAITDNEGIAKQCMFVNGVFPVLVLNMNGTDSLISRALSVAHQHDLLKRKGDKVVVLAGTQSDLYDEPCDFFMKLLYVDL